MDATDCGTHAHFSSNMSNGQYVSKVKSGLVQQTSICREKYGGYTGNILWTKIFKTFHKDNKNAT